MSLYEGSVHEIVDVLETYLECHSSSIFIAVTQCYKSMQEFHTPTRLHPYEVREEKSCRYTLLNQPQNNPRCVSLIRHKSAVIPSRASPHPMG